MTTTLVIVLIFWLGWALGALINFLADVLPMQPCRSALPCPACNAPRNWSSYLPWPRPCRKCQAKPSLRAWLVQMIIPLSITAIWLRPPAGVGFILGALVWLYFSLVLVIDIEHRLILHITSLAGSVLGLVVGWIRLGLAASLAGGLSGLVLLLVVYGLGIFFRRQSRRWQGHHRLPISNEQLCPKAQDGAIFGLGDVLFGAVLGLMVGWPEIWTCLLVTLLSAGFFGAFGQLVKLAQRRYRPDAVLPLAPFLVFGAVWVILIWSFRVAQ